MKKTLLALVLIMAALAPSAMAQKSVKLGHINSSELMQIMPGRDAAQATLQKEVEDLQATLKSMQDELETRYNEYRAKESQMSDLIKQTKQRELQDMNARMEEFGKNAQQQLQEREQELLKPIIDRAKKAIEEVGREKGYTYIFDSSLGTLLFSQDSDDIMPLVKAKLNL